MLNKTKLTFVQILFSLLIFSFILLITFFAWRRVKKLTLLNQESQFLEIVSGEKIHIQKSINEYKDILYGLRGLFAVKQNVSRVDFQKYINSINNANNILEGIQAIEFVSIVSQEEKDLFIKNIQNDTSLISEGYPNFSIYPNVDVSKEKYYVVNYIEPLSGNEVALGFDLSSNSSRKMALEESRDTNSIIATEPIRLVQESGEQSGFLMFLPIYKDSLPIETIEERKIAVRGFVLIVVKADDFFESISNIFPISKNIRLSVIDQSAKIEGRDNFSIFAQDFDKKYKNFFNKDYLISIGGREWLINFYDIELFKETFKIDKLTSNIIIMVGLFIGFDALLILYFIYSIRQRAVLIAKKMTKENYLINQDLEKKSLRY